MTLTLWNISGAFASDYTDKDTINCEPEKTEEVTKEDKHVQKDNNADIEIGKIVFVSCAAGSEETNLHDIHKKDDIPNELNSDQMDNGKCPPVLLWLYLSPVFAA